MSNQDMRERPTLSTALHPWVYFAMAGFVVWLAIAVWGFASDAYTDWLLVVVSLFVLAVVGLQFVLSRVGTHDPGAARGSEIPPEKFHDWAEGEFDTWQDHVRGKNAAIEILLPIAALAVGMTAFAIVFMAVHAGISA